MAFSLAAGLALAKRLERQPGRIFCLTSDGEWNEGSCWEALIFAKHQGLKNLTLLVDLNGLQGFGTTREVADLEPLAAKFRSFGLTTLEVDGHDCDGWSGRLDRRTMASRSSSLEPARAAESRSWKTGWNGRVWAFVPRTHHAMILPTAWPRQLTADRNHDAICPR